MNTFDEASFRAGFEWACGPDGLPKGLVDDEVARLRPLSATQPATSQEGEVRGWKCNNCQTVFTSAQQERKPNDSNGGPTCPYCKAHGQYTYPYALHQGDPCGGCGIAHDDVASGPCVPTLATKPETAQDGEDLESEIADAIDDSLDTDWTGSIGARHVMELLRSKGLVA